MKRFLPLLLSLLLIIACSMTDDLDYEDDSGNNNGPDVTDGNDANDDSNNNDDSSDDNADDSDNNDDSNNDDSSSSGDLVDPEKIIDNADFAFYDIEGDDEDELREQMDDLSPTGADGFDAGDAFADWSFRWTWPGYGESDCDLSEAKVTLDIEVVFPRWEPDEDADPELVEKWNEYIEALAIHEKGHVDYVLEREDDVLEAIQDATCDTADDAATEVLDEIRQHDLDYDEETNHGETQGARFP